MKENKKKLGKKELNEEQVGNVSGGSLGSLFTKAGSMLDTAQSSATNRWNAVKDAGNAVKSAGSGLVDAAKGPKTPAVSGTATPAGADGSDVYGLGSLFNEG